MDTCKVIQVIESTLARRGDGKDFTSPIRVITEYFTLDGSKITEVDPCANIIKLNSAEVWALKYAKDLLIDKCKGNEYRSSDGTVDINELFSKIIKEN